MANRAGLLAIWFGGWALLYASAAHAQTDYYNTDANRPVLIEDAYPTERFAFELQLAPLRLERPVGGSYEWQLDPELAYGILPRTHVELGFPVVFRDTRAEREKLGLAGIELSMLHNLNVETVGMPAIAVAADLAFPVGEFAPDKVYPSAKLILTRTYTFARFHVNGRYTFGSEPEDDPGGELSRWYAGIAVDKALPLRSLLLIGEAYALQPLHAEGDLVWNAAGGIRYQLDPRFAIDAGAGKRFGGDESWFFTFGAAYAFALRSLIPLP